MQRLILVLAMSIAVAQAGVAQAVNALRQGARIEITPVNGKPQTGRLMVLRNDSLFYAPAGVSVRSISVSGASSLAFADVKSVRVSRGRNVFVSAIVKGLIGTGIGALGGGILGAATYSEGSTDWFTSTRGAKAFTFAVLGGAGGLIVGSIYGVGNGYERWEAVDLPRR